MTLNKLSNLIEMAISHKPPVEISMMCNEYYQPYYYLMYLLAKDVEGVIVELGVNKGYGVNSFAFGNFFVKIIGLDLNVKPDFIAPNVEFYLMSALPVPDFIEEKSVAILHIDTEHSYSNAKNEFEQYKPYLLPGAVVMFDDLHAMDDSVLRAFNEFPYPKIQDDRLHPINGYGVLIYE